MNNVSLKQQLTFHTKEVDRLIKELPPNDPVKDWFFVELDALTTEELAETLSLDEENSRLRGLQQLQHLVLKHRGRLGLPADASFVKSRLDSYLTAEARLPAGVRWCAVSLSESAITVSFNATFMQVWNQFIPR